MKVKSIIAIAIILALTATFFVGCEPKDIEQPKVVELENIKNITTDSLYIEWLGNVGYNVDNPTMILVHGETPENWDMKYDMTLSEEDYVYYSTNSANYNVQKFLENSNPYLDYVIDRNLHQYWLQQNYNVGIFHYEKFADDNMEMLSKKLFNAVNLRYKGEDGYVNANNPNYSLTEILAAVYLSEIPKEAYGNEIRLIGNGIGANLALSMTDYLYYFYEMGQVRQEVLPTRLSMVDPYLSSESFGADIRWREINKAQGLLSITNDMLAYTTNIGLATELIESVEVNAELVEDESVDVLTSPYAYVYDEDDYDAKAEIKQKTAYLQLRQMYSRLYTPNYSALNRAGLDWYIYSIRGSDDTGKGYLTEKPNYESSYSNWGRYDTRPILNDEKRNNNSSRGKNYGVSAWTDTVWIRALRGVEFKMQSSDGNYLKDDENNTIKDIHDISLYTYKPYNLTRFRIENLQRAQNINKTIVAGYIWNDQNEDRIINDGVGSYLGGINIMVSLSTTVDGETKIIESFSIKTSKDGFYKVELDQSFSVSHTLKVTVIPPSSSYYAQTKAISTYHVADLSKHSFDKNVKDINISSSYGNAITIANCGMVIK